MSVNPSARSGGIIGIFFFDFLWHEGMLCVLVKRILMSTHNISLSYKKENYPKLSQMSAAMGFFLGTQEQVRNSLGKLAICVRAIEVLL